MGGWWGVGVGDRGEYHDLQIRACMRALYLLIRGDAAEA